MLTGLEAFAKELEAHLPPGPQALVATDGLAVRYGIFLGGSPCLASLERTHRWQRLLTWFDHDPRLFAAGLHLDRALCAIAPELGTRTAPPGTGPREPVAPTLEEALASSKARYFCFSVVAAVEAHSPELRASAQLPPTQQVAYQAWREAHRIDDELMAIARGWAAECPQRVVRKTDVTVGSDYALVRDLLEQHYRLFEAD